MKANSIERVGGESCPPSLFIFSHSKKSQLHITDVRRNLPTHVSTLALLEKILNKKLTTDEVSMMVGILGLHFMMTQSFTTAAILGGKTHLLEDTLDDSMCLGRVLVRELLDNVGGDPEIMIKITAARDYFGTPEEHEAKQAVKRAAYHQQELTRQPG